MFGNLWNIGGLSVSRLWRGGKADFAIPRLGSLQDLVSTTQSHAQVPRCCQREHFHLLHSKLSGQSRHHLETPARGNRSPIGRLRRDIRVPAPLSARRHGPSTTTAIATSRVAVHSLSLLSSKLCDGMIVTNTNVVDAIATINCPFSDCFQQCDYYRCKGSRSRPTTPGRRSRICRV